MLSPHKIILALTKPSKCPSSYKKNVSLTHAKPTQNYISVGQVQVVIKNCEFDPR